MTLAAEQAAADEGMERAASRAPQWWKDGVLHSIKYRAAQGEPFNSDEVRVDLQAWGYGLKWPLVIGSMFSVAAKRGIIVRTGQTRQTTIEGGHARSYPLWVGKP